MNRTIKFLTLGVIISSLFGYLEWGRGNHQFLFETERLVIQKIGTDPLSVVHPFVLMPLIGQIILVVTLFIQKPAKKWIMAGMALIALLLGFMLLVGILALNYKIVISVIPYFVFSGILVKNVRAIKSENN